MNTLIKHLKKEKLKNIPLDSDLITTNSLINALDNIDNRLSSINDPYSEGSIDIFKLYKVVKKIIKLFGGPKT